MSFTHRSHFQGAVC